MKRPWQIWTLFGLCLAIVLPAMGWLTHKALQLDRAEDQARRQAALEEDISSTLWQMDTELTRLLAPETARPYYVYQPFYHEPRNGDELHKVPSPLLMQPSQFIRLHFQLRSGEQWTSPQCPRGDLAQWAISHGARPDNIQSSAQRLRQLQTKVQYSQLLSCLPTQALPAVESGSLVSGRANAGRLDSSTSQVVRNTLDYEQVQQRLESNQIAQQAANAQPSPQADAANRQAGQDRRLARRRDDLQKRNAVFQMAAQQQIFDQRLNFAGHAKQEYPVEGISQFVWINSQLLLARRVTRGEEVTVQGCWLDWPKLKQHLLGKIGSVLPGVELDPVMDMNSVRLSRVLATLPAQLVVADADGEPALWSPIRISLLLAWCFLALAAAATASLLLGVISLSERRAAFVSAVTHELRTPLTTFKMYAEMLSQGMVSDAAQRQHYLDTLRVESDRLTHLVDNVLQYARLERGRPGKRRSPVLLHELMRDVQPRLADRAAQAEMQLCLQFDADATEDLTVVTDAAAVEQILFNLVDNACKYAGRAEDRRIHVCWQARGETVECRVCDHGPGIAAGSQQRLFRPFSKSAQEAAATAPGVGLGLALCRRLARCLGGDLELEETPPSSGARFVLSLPRVQESNQE